MRHSQGIALGEAAARRLAALADSSNAVIEPGLTSTELERIEQRYDFEFADDHRAFLSAGLPRTAVPEVSTESVYYPWERPWPDWRHGNPEELQAQIDWPVEGVLLSVEDGGWHRGWGDKPASIEDALVTARAHLTRLPRLVPVYAHRYLPPGHGTYRHAVLSIWATDVIIYGTDIDDYIEREFRPDHHVHHVNSSRTPLLTVPFWSEICDNG